MKEESKLSFMKEACKNILNALTVSDWIGIIVFNTNAQNYREYLIRANSTNKAEILNYIENLEATGNTNYEEAFTKTFALLSNTFQNEYGNNNCKKILMFLTDGAPSVGEQNATKLISKIKGLDQWNSTIFTYFLGADADSAQSAINLLKKIACEFHGFFQVIPSSRDISSIMGNYYIYVAAGLNRSTCIWTEPYDDAVGLGKVTTAAYPIYDRSSNPPYLIGVTGLDLLLEDLIAFENYDQILDELISRSGRCTSDILSECHLESLRGDYKCNSIDENTTCESIGKTAKLCSSFTNYALNEGSVHLQSIDLQQCCGNYICGEEENVGIIVGPAIGGFFGLVLIIAVIVWIVKRNNNTNQPPIRDNIFNPVIQAENEQQNENIVNNQINIDNIVVSNPINRQDSENNEINRNNVNFIVSNGVENRN